MTLMVIGIMLGTAQAGYLSIIPTYQSYHAYAQFSDTQGNWHFSQQDGQPIYLTTGDSTNRLSATAAPFEMRFDWAFQEPISNFVFEGSSAVGFRVATETPVTVTTHYGPAVDMILRDGTANQVLAGAGGQFGGYSFTTNPLVFVPNHNYSVSIEVYTEVWEDTFDHPMSLGYGGWGGSFQFSPIPVPVPLPGAALLGAIGLACYGWWQRRRTT